MKPLPRKRRKRPVENSAPRSAFSGALQTANKKLSSGEHVSALTILNGLAKGEKNAKHLGKILTLTATSEMKLSRFNEAVDIYAQATDQFRIAADPAWFNAALGKVRSLLKALRTPDAVSTAHDVVKMAKSDGAALGKVLQTSEEDLDLLGGFVVGPRPVHGLFI